MFVSVVEDTTDADRQLICRACPAGCSSNLSAIRWSDETSDTNSSYTLMLSTDIWGVGSSQPLPSGVLPRERAQVVMKEKWHKSVAVFGERNVLNQFF